jgi:hypothetical protein
MTTFTCECCWISSVTPTTLDRSHICKPCQAHLHTADNMRKDHQVLQLASADRHAKDLARQSEAIEKSKETIRALTADRDELVKAAADRYSDGLESVLQDLIRDVAVEDIEGKARSAYRHRNRAMAAVWRIDELHHSVGTNGMCQCKKSTRECTEFKALAFFRDSLYEWDQRETVRMNAGQHHGLPKDHPAAKKWLVDHWDWKGEPSTRPEETRFRRSA